MHRKHAPAADAPNAEDLGLGDQGQSDGKASILRDLTQSPVTRRQQPHCSAAWRSRKLLKVKLARGRTHGCGSAYRKMAVRH